MLLEDAQGIFFNLMKKVRFAVTSNGIRRFQLTFVNTHVSSRHFMLRDPLEHQQNLFCFPSKNLVIQICFQIKVNKKYKKISALHELYVIYE